MVREHTAAFRCGQEGCHETAFYSYASQREYRELLQRQRRDPYKCSRHRKPEQVLRPDNLERTHVLIASKVPFRDRSSRSGQAKEWLNGLYWRAEDAERAGSGLTHGPGFTAHASDFPEGTRLVITAHIEMPEEKEDLSSPDDAEAQS